MSSREPDLVLIIRHTGQVFPLTRVPITIGRQADNTIVLSDPRASRRHATISWQAGTYLVQDLGSANGTYVDERRITGPQPLRQGQALRVGDTFFDVRLPPAVREGRQGVAAAAAPHADSGRGSVLPLVLGLLLAGIVVVGLVIAAILLLAGGREAEPTAVVQATPTATPTTPAPTEPAPSDTPTPSATALTPTVPPPDTPTATLTPTSTPTPTFTPTPTDTPTSTPTPTDTPTPTEIPPQYDLYVRRMDFSPNLMVGETIELAIMLATDLYPAEGPFFPASHFRWRQGPSFPWQEEVCPPDVSYASCVKRVYFSYPAAGDYYVEVEADSRNEVRETDEWNNTRGWTITVVPGSVTVSFEAFPDGTPITADTILAGGEFLARGIRLEGAPAASSSCRGVATVPAIRRAQYGVAGNLLTTSDPGDVSRCNFGPVGIVFSNPVRRVTLTFAGATETYTLEAYDGTGGFLGAAYQDAVAYGGTFNVTLSSAVANMARVTLAGPPGAITAVTQIYFEW